MGVVFPHTMHSYQRISTTGADLRTALDAVMAGAVGSGLQYSLVNRAANGSSLGSVSQS
jgi:hypothetical protein